MKTLQGFFLFVIWSFVFLPCAAQSPREQAATTPPTRIQLNAISPTSINLKAQAAPLQQIVDQLAHQLGCKFQVSPLLRSEAVSVDLIEADLATTLRTLSQQFYLDERLEGGTAAKRQLMAGYLLAENEQPPALYASFARQLESVALSGQTDPDPSATSLSTVQVENGFITIHVQGKPLSEVLYAVAEQLGIPFVIHQASPVTVELDLVNVSVEELLLRLPDNVHLTRRLNFPGGTSTPLRLELLAPVNPAEP